VRTSHRRLLISVVKELHLAGTRIHIRRSVLVLHRVVVKNAASHPIHTHRGGHVAFSGTATGHENRLGRHQIVTAGYGQIVNAPSAPDAAGPNSSAHSSSVMCSSPLATASL